MSLLYSPSASSRLVSIAFAVLSVISLGAQTQPAGEAEAPIELPPFIVETTLDTGYWASNTLSGTRLNTENRYVGASVTEVTKQLLEDLAINNFEQVLNYVPNSAPAASGGLSADPTGNESIFGVRYRVRGFLLTGYSRDFFKTRVVPDSYNTERMSFSRGPNSVLFGIAEPGGVTNAISSRADTANDRNHVGVRFDTWDSARYEASFNRVLFEEKLAINVAAVYDDKRNHRDPWHNRGERYYGSLTFKPFTNTTLRVHHEMGEIERLNAREWAPSDGITVWRNAGSQDLPANLINPTVRSVATVFSALGVEEYAANNPWITMASGDIDSPLVYQTRWELRPAQRNVTGFNQASNGGISFTDDSIIPMTANVLGGGNKLLQDFANTSVFLEQKLARGLYLELAYNRQDTDNLPDFSTGSRDHVYIDLLPTVRSVAPNVAPFTGGAVVPNPNYGQLFTYNDTPVTFDQQHDDETLRAMLSYDFDFQDRWDGRWAKLLGRHRLAAMYESYLYHYIDLAYHFRNSMRAGNAGRYDAATTWIALQNYLNVEQGLYSPMDIASMYPRIWKENAGEIPASDTSGVAPMWLGVAGTNTRTETVSKMFAMQNYFWDDKVVTTFGWRRDEADSWSVANTLDTATGLRSDVRIVDPQTGGLRAAEGDTYSRGVVVTPISWLGFFYNESTNFRPANADQLDILGGPLGNESGEGKDYGLKLYLMKGKITGSFTFFETSFLNQSTRGPRVGPVAQFDPARVASRVAIENYYDALGMPEKGDFWNQRGYLNNDDYFTTQDFTSEGWELSLTLNPIPSWRTTLNISKQENTSSNVAPDMVEWAAFIRTVLTDPALLDLETTFLSSDGVTFNTVRDNLDVHDQRIAEIKSLEGFADQRQPETSANIVTAYSFMEGSLKGLTVGGSYRWRDRSVVGYSLQDNGTSALDATQPFYNDQTHWFGAFVGYRTRITDDIVMKLQLNIDNLLDEDSLNSLLAREVNGQRVDSRWVVPEGRSFAFSASFDF